MADIEEKLSYLRTRLWWAGNDTILAFGVGRLNPPHIENQSRLALLLTDEVERDFLTALQNSTGFISRLRRSQNAGVARLFW